MLSMKQQLLSLGQNQKGSYIRREGPMIVFNEKHLPDLIDPQGNWGISATEQWDPEEIQFIAKAPASELVDMFASVDDRWIHMGVTAELILHDDTERARAFTRELITQNPHAKDGLAFYFGNQLVEDLLTEHPSA